MRRKIWCDGWKRKYFGLGWGSEQGLIGHELLLTCATISLSTKPQIIRTGHTWAAREATRVAGRPSPVSLSAGKVRRRLDLTPGPEARASHCDDGVIRDHLAGLWQQRKTQMSIEEGPAVRVHHCVCCACTVHEQRTTPPLHFKLAWFCLFCRQGLVARRLFLSFFFKDSLKYVPGRKIFKNGSGSWRQSPAPRYKVMTPASVASSPLRRSADVE
jgi:hypothetical protein